MLYKICYSLKIGIFIRNLVWDFACDTSEAIPSCGLKTSHYEETCHKKGHICIITFMKGNV